MKSEILMRNCFLIIRSLKHIFRRIINLQKIIFHPFDDFCFVIKSHWKRYVMNSYTMTVKEQPLLLDGKITFWRAIRRWITVGHGLCECYFPKKKVLMSRVQKNDSRTFQKRHFLPEYKRYNVSQSYLTFIEACYEHYVENRTKLMYHIWHL